jgi:RNA recognition motif-containing protein
MRLYIGNILYGSNEVRLTEFLKEKGIQLLAPISWPRNDSGMRPFCLIDVPDEDAERNISELHDQLFNGRKLKVNLAHPRT